MHQAAPPSLHSGRRDSLGRRIGHNWWREYNCSLLEEAEVAWQALKESGEAIMTTAIAGAEFSTGYYQLTDREYRQIRPRPNLKELLIGNAGMSDEHRQPASINGHTPWP